MKHNNVFLHHIIDEIEFLLKETKNLSSNKFFQDEKLKRACARSLEVIGEAVKNLSADFRKAHKDVEWKRIAGLRDRIIHYYFGVDWDIVWDIIKTRLPQLKEKITTLLENPTP